MDQLVDTKDLVNDEDLVAANQGLAAPHSHGSAGGNTSANELLTQMEGRRSHGLPVIYGTFISAADPNML